MYEMDTHAPDHGLALDQQYPLLPNIYTSFGKRLFDIVAVLCAAPVVILTLLPILVLTALDKGNPFYTQTRLGRGGKAYRMWKIRSMVVNAEAQLNSYLEANPSAKEEWQRTQKLKNDPRVTKLGYLIRKTSMDELPQLWNVLIGDMSLIGPRPMLPSQQSMYPGRDYYAIRPGITGAWQVSVRNQSSFAERAQYDSQYVRNLSVKNDMHILIKTVGVVCKATGH